MNITRENVDELNAVLKMKIEKDDYSVRVENVLKDYRKKARMPGFRPGKVPSGLINKLYGKSVLIEEINKIISESVAKYLSEEKIRILGEPLPSEKNNKSIDWDNQTSFEFEFDLGLAPEVEVNLTIKDKIPLYEIQVDDKMVSETKENYARRYGTMLTVEEISGNEIIKGDFRQVDKEGNVVEKGISAESSSFSLEVIKDKDILNSFTGRKVNDTLILNVKKAFPNDTELASVLKIQKDKITAIAPDFHFTIKEISRFQKAEINTGLFDLIYGKDNVKTEEEFAEQIKKELEIRLEQNSQFKFRLDVREMLMKKAGINLPGEFLKRWLTAINKEKLTAEQINSEFPTFENNLKWQLIQDQIISNKGIKVEEKEVNEYARSYTLAQFRQYGLTEVPEDQLNTYSQNLLKSNEEKKKIYDRLYEEKVYDHIKENIKIDRKKISIEKFNKLFDK